MAYYAAVVSLRKTIQNLLDSSQMWIYPFSREILESAYQVVRTVHEVLQGNEESIRSNCSNGRLKPLCEKIREAACKLEDALEIQVSNQIQRLGDEGSPLTLSLDLKEVKKEINSFVETMKKTEETMMEELSKPLPEEDDVVPSNIDFGGKNLKMVGLSEDFSGLKDLLLSPGQKDVSIFGMAGLGKTLLALKIFYDPSISSHFDPCLFVTIGQKYQSRKVIRSILAQMKHDINEINMEEDKYLAEYIRRSLQGRRYLIVIDDVWYLEHIAELKSLLPTKSNKSRVLVTTRIEAVAKNHPDRHLIHYMRFLNKGESWDLLSEKVFGEGCLCPIQLEKFGQKIAENCEGLPLTIVTIANILSKEEKTPDYWKKVAENENLVFTYAYDQMRKVLISSYNFLPQTMKPLFLYMGVFPLRCKIRTSNLLKLWHVERFVDEYSFENFEYMAESLLKDLVSNSIVLAERWSTTRNGHAKICKLHSAYWHLCVKEAGKENFLHVMNHYACGFTKGIEKQRRLCIHNNVLFGIKDVYNSMESIPMVHSLLCTGPYLRYPVPICFDLGLLRVLDALMIRFYTFPIEVQELVLLRYLALKYSGKVPCSISKLWNLEHLIIYKHVRIEEPSQDSMCLPMEIWNMKALRHIQVTGGDLPNPCGAVLPNLITLSNVSVNSCSKEMLEGTPNLMKLGIQIVLTPDATEPLSCFGNLSHLQHLRSFKCVVVNPKPMSHFIPRITTFPLHLKKLSLSGLGYPWEYMRTIAKLPHLLALKLRCYAFQGPVWETHDGEFPKLRCLMIHDADLVHWRSHDSRSCFPELRYLIISHCYKLKEIPSSLGYLYARTFLTLVDCNSFGTSEEQLQEKYGFSDVDVFSSLEIGTSVEQIQEKYGLCDFDVFSLLDDEE